MHLTLSADQIALEDTEGIGNRLPSLQGNYNLLGEISGSFEVPRMHFDLSLTGLRFEGAYLGDARAYVRLTDREDPWVAEANNWPQALEDEQCGHARYGLAKGRWRPFTSSTDNRRVESPTGSTHGVSDLW